MNNVLSRLLNCVVLLAVPTFAGQRGVASDGLVRLATTTSVRSSGLLAVLEPAFENATGYRLDVQAVGTGRALRLARLGNADVVLVHDEQAEADFVAQGWGLVRHPLMMNEFLIVGPGEDPAGIKAGTDAVAAFTAIASRQTRFVSRGDDSGTHRKERSLWQEAGIKPRGDWYLEVGQPMRETLATAAQRNAYTLVDRGTWLAQRSVTPLQLMVRGDPRLDNPYSVIAVNPERNPGINHQGAQAFIHWLLSDPGQALIRSLTVNNEQLFLPVADFDSGGTPAPAQPGALPGATPAD
jgi:tungstate transport system substrate-binding protein